MTIRIKILSALVFFAGTTLWAATNFVYRPASVTLPELPREFRGAWITVVATNQDWPSAPGLTVEQQKSEFITLLDRAVQLHFNAVIFQVRPSCDAMYASSIEPWSERLTGTMGKAPSPFYDPLAFAVAEAHKRGLELHAWFNPFRALHPLAKSVARNHITKTHPELVRQYDGQFWLDPGEPVVRNYVQRVVMDVVRRYDVDGVQFDDYFYPYPVKNALGRLLDYPDYATWKRIGLPDGFGREDWRRQNVNRFIQGVYQNIKAVKPWVKFGISPFGIWRPGFPAQIRGLDAYNTIYADSRRWLSEGWLDYIAPQLYWPIDQREQSFPALLQWWSQQNGKNRGLWPGLYAAAAGQRFPAEEIGRQIAVTRQQSGAGGEIFFHLRSVTDSPRLANIVRAAYDQTALVPASPWLDATPPLRPRLEAVIDKKSGLTVRWQNTGGEPAWKWIFQFQTNGVWTTEILPADATNRLFESVSPGCVSVRAVDRLWNLSSPATLKRGRMIYIGKNTYIFK